METTPLSPDALVRVGSCLDVARADLARMALAREGIPAALGNANFLSWYWHYSNAVGGVTIHVRRDEAEHARAVLNAASRRNVDALPAWTCSACGQRVGGQWDACWVCGQWVDGTPSIPSAEDGANEPSGGAEAVSWWNIPRIVVLVATVGLMVLMYARGVGPLLVLAPFVGLFVFLLWQFEPSRRRRSELQIAAEPGERSARKNGAMRSELSRAIVRRAWQSAVLAIIIFPPLGFYSMRLLWKLSSRDTALGCVDVWRCWTAFFLNILAILYCLLFVWAFLGAFLAR
jgi:hypothetical protein